MDWVVLLAGGSGLRFWPLSAPQRPKQLLPLGGAEPTAVAARAAVGSLVPPDHILVVTRRELAEPLGQALDLPRDNLLVEPRSASTAPALVWATVEAERRDPEATVLSMHADWHLPDPERFREAAAAALEAARRHDRLVTVGVAPTRAETGYGYIVPGAEVAPGVRAVRRFTEKPDRESAESLIAVGALWNSGLFAWTARRLLAEIEQFTPEVAGALPLIRRGEVEQFFQQVTPISIDNGLLERSDRVVTLRGEFPWDDVGTWDAVARVRAADPDGNVVVGPAYLLDTVDTIVWSEEIPVVVSGAKQLVVVVANGRVLVLDRSRASELKELLERLPPSVRALP
jgi:mannose-1-phosphate guanylyltransferase